MSEKVTLKYYGIEKGLSDDEVIVLGRLSINGKYPSNVYEWDCIYKALVDTGMMSQALDIMNE